jgi:AraC family transcriptional regulator of adaptative response / DNA-3-methyladenine glycosylase II
MQTDIASDAPAATWYGALCEHDARYDGIFFAGVITTGVFCRSVCPVPTPAKRVNVSFFASAAAAQEAGYRPCLRCHPERSAGTPVWSSLPPVVSRTLILIADGALDDDGVDVLAQRVGTGARHLRRLFVEHLGAPPLAIAKARRTHFARRLIDDSDLSMTDIAFASGFRSVRQFNQDMRAAFGRPPSSLRRRTTPRRTPDGAVELKMHYRPPLDWPRMIRFLQARATPGVEVAEHDRYRRTIVVEGRPGVVEVAAVPTEPYVILRAWLPSSSGLISIAERAKRMFDLGADPLQIAEHLGRSPMLVRAVAQRPGLRIHGAWDPFECAVRAIMGQQISVRAATTITSRIARTYGKPIEGFENMGLTHLFPDPSALAGADIRSLGATGSQQRAIQAVSTAIASGQLTMDSAQGLDDFVARLTALPGVGPWTAHYVAMCALGEPDAFPDSDLGLRKGAAGGDRIPTARELREIAEQWRPWRSYAAMHLWNMTAAEG